MHYKTKFLSMTLATVQNFNEKTNKREHKQLTYFKPVS